MMRSWMALCVVAPLATGCVPLDEDNWRSVETFGSCDKDSDCSNPSEECISSTVPLLDGGTVSGRICT